ncbi:SARP family transcriptional regulator, regulator of embCAB operon [Frankia sp. AiPs1]|uniref:AfsR/SARP family transcriptional regulator n=1 Tax=Frankia sp. AiPa1 TaxID=573492 RepID=UPI00202B1E7A|nr:AfsR/SARP family transcriptional regulator [Frankia sp. AiPa1]MCL9762942.1 AfsR/SARP family transcriptional regulator [Frankia sp. AiPa1]
MRYEVLGPLRMMGKDDYGSINARKSAVTLAVLLVCADQIVSIDRLVTEVWNEHTPRRTSAAVHVYISQLRKLLGACSATSAIDTVTPGYRLVLGSDELDLHAFQRLVALGRERERQGRDEDAVGLLESALGLWRGPALDGLRGGPVVDGFATWLEECRLECFEMMVEVKLRLGRHREVVAPLRRLIAEHPLRETFCRQLMLALYHADRAADALRQYQHTRRILVDELGLEPGRALREVHQAILADDVLPSVVPRRVA